MKYFLLLFIFCYSLPVYPWGAKGHRLSATLAGRFLNSAVADSVKYYLDDISLEDASVWMDEMRAEPKFNYMKPWHYINIEKGKKYVASDEHHILNETLHVIEKLKNRKELSKEEISRCLKVLIHLLGDLHQPLHVGYAKDRGGNDVEVNFLGRKENLHHVWDSDIIDKKSISLEDCLKYQSAYSKKKLKQIKTINVEAWMKDSRVYLKQVYNFKKAKIDQNYVDRNSVLISKQLLKCGLRLAEVLNSLFKK